MNTEQALSYWDVIIRVTDLESQVATFQTYTQASSVTVPEAVMRRNMKEWVRQLNKTAKTVTYELEDMGRSGNLDAKITRLLSQGLVESANHTIRL